MANWATVKIGVVGPANEVAQLRELLDQHTRGDREDSITEFGEILGDGSAQRGFRWRSGGEDGDPSLIWEGQCKWDPPEHFVDQMSLRYPDCEFAMTFSREDSDLGQTYVYQNGDRWLTYEHDGYFEFKEDDTEPVHHWRASLSFQDEATRRAVLATMHQERLIVQDHGTTMYRRCGQDILSWVRQRFPEAEVQIGYSRPYTLDEHAYVNGVYEDIQRRNITAQLPQPTEEDQERLRVIERDVELTTEEMYWIADSIVEGPCFDDYLALLRLARLRSHLGSEEFDGRYLPIPLGEPPDQDGRRRRFWSFIRALAREGEHDAPYKPTKKELELLLAHYDLNPEPSNSAERVAAIRQAIGSPRWAEGWPRCDTLLRTREAGPTDEEFLRELGMIPEEGLERPPFPSNVDWTREGF